MTDLAFASAAELAAAMIRNREMSPVAVVWVTVARIEQTQPMLNAIITVAAEPAMAGRGGGGAVSRNWPAGRLRPRPDCKHQLSRTRRTVQSAANLQRVSEKFSIWL